MDAQLRKERTEADMTVKRVGVGRYNVFLDHDSEPDFWRVWRGLNGRWYGESYGRQNVMVDAPTLACAKQDIRLASFVPCAGAGADEFPKSI